MIPQQNNKNENQCIFYLKKYDNRFFSTINKKKPAKENEIMLAIIKKNFNKNDKIFNVINTEKEVNKKQIKKLKNIPESYRQKILFSKEIQLDCPSLINYIDKKNIFNNSLNIQKYIPTEQALPFESLLATYTHLLNDLKQEKSNLQLSKSFNSSYMLIHSELTHNSVNSKIKKIDSTIKIIMNQTSHLAKHCERYIKITETVHFLFLAAKDENNPLKILPNDVLKFISRLMISSLKYTQTTFSRNYKGPLS